MKIFVAGYWNQNLGDDLFLDLICRHYYMHDFYIIAGDSAMSSFVGINNLHQVKIPLLIKFLFHLQNRLRLHNKINILQKEQIKAATKCDIYCELGGSLFNEPHQGMDHQYEMRKQIVNISKNYLLLGSNFGPFYHQYQVDKYRNLFNKMSKIWLRDRYSAKLFDELDNVSYAPDLVFATDMQQYQSINDGYVLFSVIDVERRFGHEINQKYQIFMHRLIQSFIKKKRSVILMSFCANDGDLKVAKKLKRDAHSSFVQVFNHTSIPESLRVISHAQQIVATRYHSMILGWLFQKPTMVLSYSEKINHVVKDLFPSQSLLSIDDLDINSDVNKFTYNCPADIKKITQQTLKQLNDLDGYFCN